MRYDPFQQQAIDHINQGHSVIVSAPTGAGKTAIAEHVINDALANNTKVVYTAPIKALSNQKFRQFQEIFFDKIGILTGDVSINPAAPILIMTTEIFRNKVLEEKESLDDYSWVIYDEIHYLDDYERGTVWEESLMFLPGHMKILALSATIPNIDEFARWIHFIHKKPLKVVNEKNRPVPLHFFYQCNNEIMNDLNQVKKFGFKSKSFHSYRGGKIYKDEYLNPNKPASLISYLEKNNKLPCLYFSFSRKRCEYLAEEIRHFNFLNDNEKHEIAALYNNLCERFGLLNEKSASILLPFVQRGIAYHHAGMLPTLKEVVERLFTSRLIKVIFTTETFALGINMPARTVVFDELRKFYGHFFAPLKTRDFYQMAGRAGRRGIDTEGFVYSRINPHYIPYWELNRIVYGEPERVTSKFNASYATILNLYSKYQDKLYDIYPQTYHYFQQKQRNQKKAVELLRSKVRLLKELGYIRNNSLTQKGIFAQKVYGYELSLSELYEKGVLEHMSETELGALAISLVFEPKRKSANPKLSKPIRALQNMTDEIINKIVRKEKKMGITPFSKRYHFNLAPALEAWMRNEDFDKVLRYTDTDEGEVIRYFRMAIQILREILDTPVSADLKNKTKKAIDLIKRDIIDAERQLRL